MKKHLQEGLFRSSPGILSEIRKRVTEEGEEDTRNTLSTEISRFSFLVGTRLESAKEVGKQIRLSSAITLLTQAQILSSTDKKEARKLFNLARRLGK